MTFWDAQKHLLSFLKGISVLEAPPFHTEAMTMINSLSDLDHPWDLIFPKKSFNLIINCLLGLAFHLRLILGGLHDQGLSRYYSKRQKIML